jgi:hypothetical protein
MKYVVALALMAALFGKQVHASPDLAGKDTTFSKKSKKTRKPKKPKKPKAKQSVANHEVMNPVWDPWVPGEAKLSEDSTERTKNTIGNIR